MERKWDVITGSDTKAEHLYTIRNFPVNMLADGDTDEKNDVLYEMQFGIFPDSGVIQLTDLVPQELVYIDTHSNAVGGIWNRQHAVLAEMVRKEKPEKVLEIGGVLVY